MTDYPLRPDYDIEDALEPIEPIPDGYIIVNWASGSNSTVFHFKDYHHWTRKVWGIVLVAKNRNQEIYPWSSIHHIKVIGNSEGYKNERHAYDVLTGTHSCQSPNCQDYSGLRENDGESS